MSKFKNNTIINYFILAGIVSFIMLFSSDFELNFSLLTKFNYDYLFILIPLFLVSILLKYFRWVSLLKALKIDLKWQLILPVFCKSLLMVVTPGKMGELIKVNLVKAINNEIGAKIAATVIIERFMEFTVLIFLAIISVYLLGLSIIIIIVLLAFTSIVYIFLFKTNRNSWLFNKIRRFTFIDKRISLINDFRSETKKLLKKEIFLSGIILSLLSWIFEAISISFLIRGFLASSDIINNIAVYFVSTLIGAISMLPAGAGVNDGSIIYYLSTLTDFNGALLINFSIRIVIILFPIFIGAISFVIFKTKIK